MTDNSLLQDFITETGEHLEETERNLLRLEQQPGDAEVLNTIFRSIHTIKGSSEYLGMERIAELSHKLESLLDQMRRGECEIDDDTIDLLMSGNDRISTLVNELEQHQEEQSSIDDLLSRLSNMNGTDELQPSQADETADPVEAYDDEYDEELFGIFAEQLKEGLEGLARDAAKIRSGQAPAAILDSSAERLSALRSSANYMGYDELKDRYIQWEQAVQTALDALGKNEALDAEVFSRDVMIENITQIQTLFPNVPGLKSILTSTEVAAAPESESEVESDPTHDVPVSAPDDEPPGPAEQDLLQDFITETGEHLEDTERNLLQLEQEPDNTELLNDIFRSIHTIKGSSEYLGMERIAELSHKLESLLDRLRRGERGIDSDVIDLLISGNDRITTLVSELHEHQAEQSTIDDLLSRLSDMTLPPDSDGMQDVGAGSDLAPELDDDYDEELFGIFVEQLKEGLEGLAEDARQMDSGADVADALKSSAERLPVLRSSANYMGYDELKGLYEKWEASVDDAAQKVDDDAAFDPAAFSRDVMISNITRIQELFPKATELKSILESAEASAATPEDETETEPQETVSDQSVEEELLEPADQSLLADFIAETGEHLDETERNLLRLEQEPGNAEVLNDIFRSIHTIKGSSEYLGMVSIAELSHKLESLLDLLRSGERTIDNNAIDLLIDTSDRIGQLMEDIQTHETENSATDDLVVRLDDLLQSFVEEQPEQVVAEEPPFASEEGTKYAEAYDQELFGIFMDQLKPGLQVLTAETERMSDPAEIGSALDACTKLLSILRSSANYMEYDDLKALYEQWLKKIEDVMSDVADGELGDTDELIEQVMHVNIEKVRQFFPDLHSVESSVSADEDASGPGAEGDMSTEAPTPEKVELDLDSIPMDDIDAQPGMETLEDLSGSDDPLMEKLASAFDNNLGISELVKSSAYPEDIESDLFSGEIGSVTTNYAANIQEPTSEIDDHEEDVDSADVESMLFSGGKPSKRSTEPVVLEPPTMEPPTLEPPVVEPPTATAPSPDAVPSPPSEPSGPRGGFKMGRRQSDKFRERLQKQSIRVDAGKIDSLMNQVGELVVSRSGFNQLFADMRELQLVLKQSQKLESQEMLQIKEITNRISEATVSLGRVTSELQENVMKVRMLPIAQLFSRYPRLVHDLVRNTDKQVNLEIQGEETELDKMVIEQIADPLIHIIRNAVDHGIESVVDRRQKGKSESGTLRLEAYHESNYVVIEISDDGSGIDAELVKARALEKGFVTEDEVQEMGENELIALIMRPGFSTTSEITTTSGRGVGMDVVKDNVEKLNGSIDISTTVGKGASFRIKIPLTLAIIPALLVRVRNEVFTIPLATVDETLRVNQRDLSTIEGLEVYYLRDTTVPLIRLDQVFNMPGASVDRDELFVVVVNTGTRQVGFVVDELRGRQEVVIKPLEDYLQEKSGFSGATILGDGSISLILDVFELIHLSLDQHAANLKTATA